MSLKAQLIEMGACKEAVEWVGRKQLKTAWEKCGRADWMLWLAGRVGVDRKPLVLAACDCAETALQHVTAGEDRPRIAIETARKWCAGETTITDVMNAANAAYAEKTRKQIPYKVISAAMEEWI